MGVKAQHERKTTIAPKHIANYSKRLGLSGYSSRQLSVCVETEISNIDDVAGESSRLCDMLRIAGTSQRHHSQ